LEGAIGTPSIEHISSVSLLDLLNLLTCRALVSSTKDRTNSSSVIPNSKGGRLHLPTVKGQKVMDRRCRRGPKSIPTRGIQVDPLHPRTAKNHPRSDQVLPRRSSRSAPALWSPLPRSGIEPDGRASRPWQRGTQPTMMAQAAAVEIALQSPVVSARTRPVASSGTEILPIFDHVPQIGISRVAQVIVWKII
jgi:hypothetical protein